MRHDKSTDDENWDWSVTFTSWQVVLAILSVYAILKWVC